MPGFEVRFERQLGDVRIDMCNPQEQELGKVPHRVVAFGPDGAERWTIEQWDSYHPFSEPVVADGRFVYAMGSDLLEVDVGEGRIVRRDRLPGRIYRIEVQEDPPDAPAVLRVELDGAGLLWDEGALPTAIRYRLGDVPPGRSGWFMLASSYAAGRATALLPNKRFDDMTPTELGAALTRLDEAQRRDATNPYFRFRRGQVLARLGRGAEAAAAYHEAAELPAAVWSDLIRLSWLLEAIDCWGDADLAFDRGYERMLETRVRPERMQSLVAHNVLFGLAPRDSVAAAIEAEDVDRVHELETRRWRVFPKLELGPEAWRALAEWMAAQGRDDLADVWRERASVAEDGWLNRLEHRGVWIVNTIYPMVFGLVLAVPLIAFVLGVRIRSQAVTRWTPVRALATLALPLLLAFPLAAVAVGWSNMFDLGVADDTYAAPSVAAAFEARPPSDARDEVLAFARAESAAFAEGGWYDGPMPDEATIAEAFTPMPRWRERFEWADQWIGADALWTRISPTGRIDSSTEYALLLLLPFGFGLLLFRFAPRAARAAAAVIPGAAEPFSVAGGLLLGAFIAGLLAVLAACGPVWGWDPMWVMAGGGASTARNLGFEQIWDGVVPEPSLAWAYACVIGIPIAQALLLWRQHRRAR